MYKALITLLLGSSLVVRPLSTALGNENTGLNASQDRGWTTLPLPPVPHLDTIHWLPPGFDFTKQPNVLGSQLDTLSLFLIDPKTPPIQFLSSGKAIDGKIE
jgi:hypothetical protein